MSSNNLTNFESISVNIESNSSLLLNLTSRHFGSSLNEQQNANNRDGVAENDQNDPLKPHGRRWKTVEHLNVDPCIGSKYSKATHIEWSSYEQLTDLKDRGPMHYFLHFFPLEVVASILKHTNEEMHDRGYVGNLSKGELFRWMGVQLTMCIQPQRGGIDSYWKSPEDGETAYQGGNFLQRFKMSRKRYLKIRECLRFTSSSGENNVGEVSIHLKCLIYIKLLTFLSLRTPGVQYAA